MRVKQLAIVVSLVCIAAPAGSTGLIAGATEITQVLNNIQLVLGYIESVQQTVTQLKQYEAMLKNLKTITPSSMLDAQAQGLWNAAGMDQTFLKLRHTIVDGQSLSYSLSQADAQFKRLHPGSKGYGNGFDFSKALANWSDNTLDAVKTSAGMIGIQSQGLQDERGLLGELRARSSSAEGQLQALQAGNEINAAMVSQLQQLRALQMAEMKAQNEALAAEQSRKDANDDVLRRVMSKPAKVQTYEEILRDSSAKSTR